MPGRTSDTATGEGSRTAGADARETAADPAGPPDSRAADAESILRAILDSIPEGIVLVGGPPNYPILANSRFGQELTGRPLDTAVGVPAGRHAAHYGLLLPEGRQPHPEELPLYRASRLGERVRNVELLIERADGERIPILVDAAPIRDASGRIAGAVNCWRDISERKRAEAAARAADQQLRIITEAMAAPVTRCSRDLKYLWVSRHYAEWLGRTPDEIVGRPIQEILGADVFTQLRPYFEEVLTGRVVRYETEVPHPQTGRRWIDACYTPTFDADGECDGWVAVVLDVTAQKEQEEALREADRRKDEFLAMLAHELRNPLAPIRTAVRLLRERGPQDAALERLRTIIDRQAENMARLLDDLLDVGRISRGMVRLRRETLDLSDVVRAAFDTVQPTMEDYGHQVELSLTDQPLRLRGDRLRLEQVVVNLLSNAAKYTPEGGRISLSTAREGDLAVLCVRDNGRGIAPELLPHVFDLFTQGERSLDRTQGGLGIGLTMVRSLVEMHDGAVEAYSDGPDRGAEFVVRLPIRAARDEERREIPGLRGAARPPASEERPSHRVLVVDDVRDGADTLVDLVSCWGYEARAAYSGEEALHVARAFRPHAVLLDLGMPRIDGYEVARRLRADPEMSATLLVALTGYGRDGDREQAREAGFEHHLTKPVDPEALKRVLALLLASR